MSEMVERVARAICSAQGNDPDGDVAEWKPNLQDPTPRAAWTDYTIEARAAIKAMREPTEKMCAAPESATYPDHVAGEPMHVEEHGTTWRAMIDEALR